MAQRVASPVFVGRRAELAVLEAALAQPARTAAVLVAGEAGAGKTRLVAEFSAAAGVARARVVTGTCVALGAESLPFAPFMDALGELVSAVGVEEMEAMVGTGRSDLARLVPQLRHPGDEARPAGEADRSVLFQVVARTLEAVTTWSPLVVVLEDLHWADTSSRELLAFLLGRLQGPVLLVGTYRSDEIHHTHPLRPVLAQAARSERVVRIELAPLTPDEVACQVEAIVGAPAAPAVLEAVVARAEGNPFFVEELLAGGGGEVLPPDLAEVLSARLASLPSDARELVRVAAVAGRRVSHELLAAAVGGSQADAGSGLREAISHNVLVADDSGAYAFRHALLAEAAYAEVLPAERVALHRAYATALADHPEWSTSAAGTAGELAQHWMLAKDTSRAFEAAVAAAAAAAGTSAFAEAHALYEQALALRDQAGDAGAPAGPDRVDLLQRTADSAVLAGATARAVELLRAALAHLDAEGRPARAAMLYERLARLLSESGETEASLAASRAASALMPTEPSAERAQVIGGEARALLLAGRNRQASELAEEAVEVARAAGARQEEGYALNTLGTALGRVGQLEPAVAFLEEALAIAQSVGSLEDMRRAYGNLTAILVAYVWDPDRAAAIALEGAAHLDELSYASGALLLRSRATGALLDAGRWAEAEELACGLLASTKESHTAWQAHYVLGKTALYRGDFASAHLHLDEAEGMWSNSSQADYRAQMALAMVELALAEGRLRDARVVVDDALRALEGSEIGHYTLRLVSLGLQAEADDVRASARARQDARERGEALIARARAGVAEGPGTLPGIRQDRAVQALCEAEWTRVQALPDAGAWVAVLDAWSPSEPHECAYARFRQAEAMIAAGAKEEGVGVLRQAFSEATALGAGPLIAQIEALARRARVRVGTGSAGEPGPGLQNGVGLTRREIDVLALVADGHTNRQIAEALFMSEKTASVHVSRILTKLGVANRGQAAALAHRLEVLEARSAR